MNILNPEIEQLFLSDSRSAVALVYMDHPSGVVRTHTGAGPQEWDNEIWYGTGEMGSIGLIKDGDAASQVQLTLKTTDPAQIADVVRDDMAGSEVRIYLAALDSNMRIAAVQLMYLGFVNQTPVEYDDLPSISVDCVGVEYRWNAAKENTRYTSGAQRALYER